MITLEEREKERALFQTARAQHPDLFVRLPMIDDDALLSSIGIEGLEKNRPLGYLRLMPQDFIVEEISRDDALHTVDIEDASSSAPKPRGDAPTLYCDLVKIGASTLDIKNNLAHLLSIEDKDIGYAGIKDRVALTGQAISIRNLRDPATLKNAEDQENFFLKSIHWGKGVIANGDLWGNRFIITVRAEAPLGDDRISLIARQMEEINESGFWNYFYIQRFGTPRLIGHRLGLLIARGEYESTVKMFVTHATARELPYFKEIRRYMENLWGNWPEILKRLEPFPYHFHLELLLIRHLANHPGDFLGALHTLPDQIRMWVYAYDSYLFNKKLSELIRTGTVPMSLPLATSFNPADVVLYREFLEEDLVKLPARSWKDFPFVRVGSRTWPTLQEIKLLKVEFHRDIAIFAFSLPKGTYATTYLTNFFTLASGLPTPPGINAEQIDAKAAVGFGSLASALERFRPLLERRIQDINADSQE